MTDLNIAIVGSGYISSRYLQNAPLFKGVKIVGVADIVAEVAQAQAARFGIEALSVDAALRRDDIHAILNLTVPDAHFDVSFSALTAGKHVFSEKPLAVTVSLGRKLVAEAEARKLALAVAPDTFLGPGARASRALIADGTVGRIVAGNATFMSHGMEHWHPNPTFFFKPGGGPVLDMGPYYVTTLSLRCSGRCGGLAGMTAIGLSERVVTAAGR